MTTTTGKLIKIEVLTIDGQWEDVLARIDPAEPNSDETVVMLVTGSSNAPITTDFSVLEGRVISYLVSHYGLTTEQAVYIMATNQGKGYHGIRVSTPAMIDI